MKKIFLVIFCSLSIHAAKSQCNEIYPFTEGSRFEYEHQDKKGKVTTRSVNTFKNVSGTGHNMRATVVQEIIDTKKNERIGSTESEWVCENGVLNFTVNTISTVDSGKPGDPGMTVDVTGDKMDVPSNLAVGQTLRDMKYNMKMSMSGMTIMDRDFTVKDRRVESKETVTTPAGTFECFKITFATTSEKGIGKGTIKSAMWYAKGVGLVKTENYTDDGKLNNKQILTRVVK
jgi:hypothetical protein